MSETTKLASTLSPEFIGIPKAPTASEDAEDNQIANVGYVKSTVGVDDELSTESEHAVQNKVITDRFLGIDSDIVELDEKINNEKLRAEIAENLLAPKESPVFTGNPTAPNIDSNSVDTSIANKKYVDDVADNYYINYNQSGQNADDILTAINSGKNIYCVETILNVGDVYYPLSQFEDPGYTPTEVSLKFTDGHKEISLVVTSSATTWTTTYTNDSIELTGTPTAPTAPAGTNTDQIATTAFVNDALQNSDAMRKGIDYVTAGHKASTELGSHATAEGINVTASGDNSHAEGYQTISSGDNSHAEGVYSTASGLASHAEGYDTTARGNNSHSEGFDTVANSDNSHAEGNNTNALGNNSHTEGLQTIASGLNSHAEGTNTVANHRSQHVFGEFNTADGSLAATTERGNFVEVVGNGLDANNTSNARTLDWQGNEVLAGKLTVGTQPTEDNDVATKKYVDDNISSIGSGLPSVTTVDDGKVLTVVDGQWDKAEPQGGGLEPIIVKLGVNDIWYNSLSSRIGWYDEELEDQTYDKLVEAFQNNTPVYFDLIYGTENNISNPTHVSGYASMSGIEDTVQAVSCILRVHDKNSQYHPVCDLIIEASIYAENKSVSMSFSTNY